MVLSRPYPANPTELTVGSLFSGIGGFDLGFERAGWRVIWQVENNPFRQKILKRHWPDVELRNDIRTNTDGLERPDLICGGFPCQDLSVAGNRRGLLGERSALWYEYLRMVRTLRPTWVVIENVPGLLSSHKGKDFEIIVNGLAQCGYGVAWRVLDSQYFGVAQRRRRVYIVGHLGAECPLEILFEPESGEGPTPAGRAAGAQIASTLGGGAPFRGWRVDFDRSGAFIPVARTLHVRGNKNDTPDIDGGVVSAPSDADGVRETARVPGRVDTPDSPRYAALGDAVTVNVAQWIAERIRRVEKPE